jgi:hypothetical protein
MQIQYLIRALKNKVYHGLAVDCEKCVYWNGMSPQIAVTMIRDFVNGLKHARKNKLISDVPIGIYTGYYFNKDICGNFLNDDIASGLIEFVWEARWMNLPASKPIEWSQIQIPENMPPADYKPLMNNVGIWQYRGGGGDKPAFKLTMTPGGQHQAADLNFIMQPIEQFYEFFKFKPGTTPPPAEPPTTPPSTPGPVDLSGAIARLDKIQATLDRIYR